MNEFIEKLTKKLYENVKSKSCPDEACWAHLNKNCDNCDSKEIEVTDVIRIANELAEEYGKDTNVSTIDAGELLGNGWIPCSERLPEVETTVLIHARRKYRDGGFRDIITTAMYEDGTVLENDSCWHWEDIDGEWDEENDCYIIPEGWWEDKKYNADGELNHAVDNEVLAWQPLPAPYQPKGEQI